MVGPHDTRVLRRGRLEWWGERTREPERGLSQSAAELLSCFPPELTRGLLRYGRNEVPMADDHSLLQVREGI